MWSHLNSQIQITDKRKKNLVLETEIISIIVLFEISIDIALLVIK